jgi:hypothetical protein
MVLQIGDVELKCGRRESGQARLEQLARALALDSAPLPTAVAIGALAKLGRGMTDAERPHAEQALASATATLESAGTSNPGLIEYARSVLLVGLGRGEDASASWHRVFIYPDRGLSHALARSRQWGLF